MKITTLFENISHIKLIIKSNIDINDLSCNIKDMDSPPKNVSKTDLLFLESRKNIFKAVSNGARNIVVQEKKFTNIKEQIIYSFLSLIATFYKANFLITEDLNDALANISAKFYDYPDRKLTIIGVTGTNGKTSITYMTESILKKLNIDIGVFGTINYRFADYNVTSPITTPRPLDLYKLMAEMVKLKIKYLIMEVSSMSLVESRVKYIDFDIAVFTNLTQDHLDYHKNMEQYFDAKKTLFYYLSKKSNKKKKVAIINYDDNYGKKLLNDKNITADKISYSTISKFSNSFFLAQNIFFDTRSCNFTLISNFGKKEIKTNQIGLHNIYNIMAVVAICSSIGIEQDKIIEAIKNINGAPGRLEQITSNKNFSVMIDYAHTDDALKNVLSAISKLIHSRVITVFGCGGNRDKTKRPKMGEVACNMSDFVFITSDNPRKEDPIKIIEDIEKGAKKANKNNYKIIIDREEAIRQAILTAKKNDIVLIAGKGHEKYQIIGDSTFYFDDKEVASKILNSL